MAAGGQDGRLSGGGMRKLPAVDLVRSGSRGPKLF
jgi:hypothetical protein